MENTTAPSPIRWWPIVLKLVIIFIVAAAFGALYLISTMPDRADAQQTLVLGNTRFVPDSQAALRVVVQEVGRGAPVEGAQVRVSLEPDGDGRPLPLFEGQTDASGSLPLEFHVPAGAGGPMNLVVETESPAGRDEVRQRVTVERDFRLLLSSDKPLYQPGQTIHLRALALSAFDLTPAREAPLEFLVEDPKGNKVFRQTVTASDFGVAAADFVLADLVNQGDYKLSVSLGDTRSERTVEVRPYVLPKFGLEVSTERSFYLPGERVSGVVQADYFYGKPVAGGQVQLTGVVYDVERTVVVDLRGETDETGAYEFGFELPDYFAGSGLDTGQAQFGLEVTVIDQAEHPEQTSRLLPVAAEPLVIEAVAESGLLKPGVENVIYILTAYPDGQPAQTELEISVDGGPLQQASSGEFGLAQFRFTPQPGGLHTLSVAARDETGRSALRRIDFEAEGGADHVLLRADRATYLVGETMQLTALTPVEFGDVYLDIVRDGQTLSTRSARVERGQVEFAIDLSPDLYGTLELHAYKVLRDGTVVRDTRVVVVDAPRDIAVAVSADRDSYLPGELATLEIETTGSNGAGLQTALGVAIVDESVFALQRQDPGFAKLYFLLEAELLEPFYQIKGFELPAALPPDQTELRLAQDSSAKALWADAPASGLSLSVNSRPQKMQAIRAGQRQGYERLGTVAAAGLILLPLLLGLAVAVFLRRAGLLGRALKRTAVALLLLLLAGCGLAVPLLRSLFFIDEEVLLVGLGGGFGLGLLALAGYAWLRRDEGAKYLFLLSAAWVGLLIVLIIATDTGPEPADILLIVALIAALLVPLAHLTYGQGLWVQGRRWPGGLVTGLGALAALPALAVLADLPLTLFAFGAMAPPVAVEEQALPSAALGDTETAARAAEPAAEGADTGTAQAPRLRQFFPETLYWNPEVLTDESGTAQLTIPLADSITTWRLTALASSQDGRLGFTTQGIRVFQDFFVDIDLPVSLTQDDQISIPVGVFNYLPQAQEVRLAVEQEPWFELLGPAEQTLTIAANDIEVVYFPIRAVEFGRVGFQVTAWGSKMSDAIRREVNVVPNGKEIRLTESDWLRQPVEVELDIPAGAVAGTPYVEVKIYPGVMAQVVEGLEKILRLPHG
ncbi:MAG: alpha-2-macroglobulin family protein [Anaerolineae bacterium]